MEGTNIPDELTYHEPSPRSNTERRGTLFMTARVVSTIFTPFMVPFIAFFLLFFFTYLRIMPLQYKLTVLALVYCFTILLPMLGIYLFRNQRMGHSWTQQPQATLCSLRTDLIKLSWLLSHDVPDPPAPLHVRNHSGHHDLHDHLQPDQSPSENQYTHGQQRHDGRRPAILQFHFPV